MGGFASMSLRRIERVVLGTGLKLSLIHSMNFVVSPSNKVANDFFERFLPDIRYNNPSFKFARRLPDSGQSDHIVIDFGEHGTHIVNLSIYPSSHTLAQRISNLDAELFDTFR
eukprot:GDKJ01038529.1.p1 GENE.GDKJ01038529.1~~GDKJ01038529.1.p1  ORF type:complete len:113 (-),score=14.64 GDKJ01038529.1:76-414(-)